MTTEKKFIIEDNDLMQEWNWDKNNELGLNPNALTFGSNKKAWWKCKENHDWFVSIDKKVKGKNCPFCSNRRILSGYNDLATLFPHLLEEWHYEKNKGINPNKLSINSVIKVNWKCKSCHNEWIASIRSRATRNTGCPKCSLIKRGKTRHKQSLILNGCFEDDSLLKEWDYEKNDKLPTEYTKYSNESVWWKCSKCGYNWKSKIGNRTKLKRGCPCCANLVIVKGVNDLAITNPELLKEWHPTKNTDITPYQVTSGSRRKVWWLCSKGHEYQASLLHRRHGTKCPICYSGRQTSFAEQCVYYYVKKLYPDAINKFKADWLGGFELDIYIPSMNYAIEYDGIAWHKKNKIEREQRKYKLCHERNIKLIRLREEFAELGSDIADYQYGCEDLYKPKNLEMVLKNVLTHLNFSGWGCPISVDIERDKLDIQEYMKELDKDSFADKFPNIAKEWHPIKNGTLKPTMFKPHSTHKVWWLCPICKNEYQTTIDKRSYGSGCKKCAMKRFFTSNIKSVEMIDIETNKVIKTFKSISDASRETKINISNITMVCKGVRKYAGGYIWKYTKKD